MMQSLNTSSTIERNTMRETVVEQYLKKIAKKNNFLCFKFISPGNNGVPDRILIGNGLTFFIETKAPGEKPRRLQMETIKKIQKHGAIVYTIDTKDQIDKLFEELMKNS